MRAKPGLNFDRGQMAGGLGRMTAVLVAVVLSASVAGGAGPPASSSAGFGGIYKVASSTDPLFPATRTREYFLDFGRGIQMGKLSGNVAVSERRNPNVRVRIMVWQYFPDQARIAIGNPCAEGSPNAVLKGAWRMKGVSQGILFERGSYQVVLRRADPKDY